MLKKALLPFIEKSKDDICAICERPGGLIHCHGGCNRSFHQKCLGLSSPPSGIWSCPDCARGVHICFQCKGRESDSRLVRCTYPGCNRYFHWRESCCGKNPHYLSVENYICPSHKCTYCGKQETSKEPLLKCFRCTKAYHMHCLPPDSIRLNSKYFLCGSHRNENPDMPPSNSYVQRNQSPYIPPMSPPQQNTMRSPYQNTMMNPPYYPPMMSPQQNMRNSPYQNTMMNPPYASPNYPPQQNMMNSPYQNTMMNSPYIPPNYPPQQYNGMPQGRYPPPMARSPNGNPVMVNEQMPPTKKQKVDINQIELTIEQKAGKSLLSNWRDLRRAGIELMPERIKARAQLLQDVKGKAKLQRLNTQKQREKMAL